MGKRVRVVRDNIQGITKPAIRRLARRGGVKRINGLIYDETRDVLRVFLGHAIRDATTYTWHARRKTVTVMDVIYALKRQGRTLYGYDKETKSKVTRRRNTGVDSQSHGEKIAGAKERKVVRELATVDPEREAVEKDDHTDQDMAEVVQENNDPDKVGKKKEKIIKGVAVGKKKIGKKKNQSDKDIQETVQKKEKKKQKNPDKGGRTREQERVFEQALGLTDKDYNGYHTLLAKPSDSSLGKHSYVIKDIHTLAPGVCLNEATIDAFLGLIGKRSKQKSAPVRHIVVMNGLDFRTIIECPNDESRLAFFDAWTKEHKVDFPDVHIFMAPHRVKNDHWCLVVVDFGFKKFQYYDSLGSFEEGDIMRRIEYMFTETMKGTSYPMEGWTHDDVSLPVQHNDFDSGMFVCTTADYLSHGLDPDYTQRYMPAFRIRMVKDAVRSLSHGTRYEFSSSMPLSYDFTGLDYIGNSCFIDSVLVCIFATPNNQIIADLLRRKDFYDGRKRKCSTTDLANIQHELIKITDPMRRVEENYSTVTLFREAMKQCPNGHKFHQAKPADPDEFLKYLFDLFEVPDVSKRVATVYGRTGSEKWEQLEDSRYYDSNAFVQKPNKELNLLEDGCNITDFIKEELISRPERWKNKHTERKETQTVLKSQFIIISISRDRKTWKPISAPKEMTLSGEQLQLTAIVVNDGNGHYVAKFKRGDEWFDYDDQHPDLVPIGQYDRMLLSKPSPLTHGTMFFYVPLFWG